MAMSAWLRLALSELRHSHLPAHPKTCVAVVTVLAVVASEQLF
jgi:hypothetical protein